MTQQRSQRPGLKHRRTKLRLSTAFVQASAPAAAAGADFPMVFADPDTGKSTLTTGALSSAIHLGIIGLLFLFAALAPEVMDEIIPVQLLKEKPERAPAPARRVLAERRKLDFAPAMQTARPQVVNPRVVAEATPAVHAEKLQVDALNAVAAPTQVNHSAIDVGRISALGAVSGYKASKIEVNSAAGPAVRGPVRAAGPVGPSAGPRKVAGTSGNTAGTGSLAIAGGSSVRDGVLSSRDVLGAPTGGVLVSVDTAVGEGNLRGPGGTGTGLLPDGANQDCLGHQEVQSYMELIESRVYSRWHLASGIGNTSVVLRFAIDVAGSTSSIELVTGDNALGAGAVDAMRAASPFPPMPDPARCLADRTLKLTFTTSSVAGS
jgi:TonB family protein